MISFRYHLVTIVAIFLALGLGVLAGTTVVNQGLVNQLKQQTENANGEAEQARLQRDQLAAQLERTKNFAEDVIPGLEQGRLTGTDVVLVTYDGMDGAALDEAQRALKESGATTVGVLSLTNQMAAPDDATRQKLAKLLGMPATTPTGTMARAAASQLADRLAAGQRGSDDPLFDLLDGGFLVSSGIKNADLPNVGGGGQAVVVLAGGSTDPPVPPESFMVPLVENLVKEKVPVAAGESGTSGYEFVTLLRSKGVADGQQMVTVDDVDEPTGGLALVLGLRDLLFSEQGGNYGFKPGADGSYPAVAPQ